MPRFLLAAAIFSALFWMKSADAQTGYREITVKPGDTLSTIARDNLDNPSRWRELLQYNQIDNPNLIKPGLRIKVPDNLARRPEASLISMRGSVQYLKFGSTEWTGAEISLLLFKKDALRTGASSRAEVRLKNGVSFVMTENTQADVTGESSADGPFVRRGRLNIFTHGPVSDFHVRSPTAVASVRGTSFLVEVDEKENSSFACHTGLVAVTAEGVTVELPPGYATFVEKGKAPSKPYPLPEPPPIEQE